MVYGLTVACSEACSARVDIARKGPTADGACWCSASTSTVSVLREWSVAQRRTLHGSSSPGGSARRLRGPRSPRRSRRREWRKQQHSVQWLHACMCMCAFVAACEALLKYSTAVCGPVCLWCYFHFNH